MDPTATRALGAPVRLADYRPPAWLVDSVTLTIALDFNETSVHAILAVRRNPAVPSEPLRLDGAGLPPTACGSTVAASIRAPMPSTSAR